MCRLCARNVFCLVVVILVSAFQAMATQRYVDINNAGSAAPYTDWSSAATSISDAVSVSVEGDSILVRDGVYRAGSTLAFTNVALESVNGADQTIMECDQKILHVQGSNGLVRGFSFTGVTNDTVAVTVMNLARMDACKVYGNHVENGAVLVGGVFLIDRAVLSGTEVYENQVTENAGKVVSHAAGGVFLATKSVMTNCVVRDNRVTGSADTNCLNGVGGVFVSDSCIYASDIAGNVVTGSIIQATGGIFYGQGMKLIGCLVRNNEVQSSYIETNEATLVGGIAGSGDSGNREGLFINCSVVSNQTFCKEDTEGRLVGGIYFLDNSLTYTNRILESTISHNEACAPTMAAVWLTGGVEGGHITMTNALVEGNVATGGVAIAIGGISATQESRMGYITCRNNAAYNFGMAVGGVWFQETWLQNGYIGGNYGNAFGNAVGGGMLGGSLLRNCLVVDNVSTASAMAVGGMMTDGNVALESCTVAGNTAHTDAVGTPFGGLLLDEGTLINTIVQDNTGGVTNYADSDGVGDGTNVVESSDGGTEFRYCCFRTVHVVTNGGDNLDADAGLINAAADNYRLRATSVCRSSGAVQDWMTNAVDVAGRSRIRDGKVDRGAYQFFVVDNDFDGDGLSDIGCYYAAAGQWFIDRSSAGYWSGAFGYAETAPVTGDFDGDGYCDYGVYYARTGLWNLYKSTTGPWSTAFGYAGTVPITGDFDGDEIADFGCYYAPNGDWYVYRSSEGFWHNQFGYAGTVPVTGDFDGDGRCDFGCYYAPGGNWYIYKSSEGLWQNAFGYEGTVPVTGDFDGDGRCDFGCYYAPDGYWYIYKSTEGFWVTKFGYEGTIPVTGDYDGDGRCDFGCYYPTGGNWYLYRSFSGFVTKAFGFEGTVPIGQ